MALASTREGDSWDLPDDRPGIVKKLIPLEAKTSGASVLMRVASLTDGQTIHLIKASREKRPTAPPPPTAELRPVTAGRVVVRLPVANLEKATRFYTAVLGLPITGEKSGSVEIGKVLILVRLAAEGSLAHKADNGWRSLIRVETKEIEATLHNARALGARIRDPLGQRGSLRFFRCEDLDHNIVEVIEDSGVSSDRHPPDQLGLSIS